MDVSGSSLKTVWQQISDLYVHREDNIRVRTRKKRPVVQTSSTSSRGWKGFGFEYSTDGRTEHALV
jgi:hypothetical protein